MPAYLILFSFTPQGIHKIKESPARIEAARRTVEAMGGTTKAFYALLGSQYDTLFVIEARDDESLARMSLAIASGGNVRTESHRLFTEAEYRKVVSSLS